MAICEWIARQMDLTGWIGWSYLRVAAGMSEDDLSRLTTADDLSTLKASTVSRLARLLGVTAKQLRRIDMGEIVEVKPKREVTAEAAQWQAAIDDGSVVVEDWPPKPLPLTPTVGEANWRGEVEIGDGEPIPDVYGPRCRCFAIKVFPGDRAGVFRLMSQEWLRDGADVAVWEMTEYDDGHGYVGRVEGRDQAKVYLRLANNEILPVARERVVRIAKEIATYPPSLNGVTEIAAPHAAKETHGPKHQQRPWWDPSFLGLRGTSGASGVETAEPEEPDDGLRGGIGRQRDLFGDDDAAGR